MKVFFALFCALMIHGCGCSGAFAAYPSGFSKDNATIIKTVVIANAGTTSTAVDLAGYTLVGVKTPSALTGTAITYTMSDTLGGTYVAVHNSSGAVSTTVTTGRYYAINWNDFLGVRFLKLVSGSSEGAERTIQIMLRAM